MGLANRLGEFTHKLSDAVEPLRIYHEAKKNAFLWTPKHVNAFNKINSILCSPPVLAPFDPNLPTMLPTDASRLKSLRFVLLQWY